MQYNIKWSEKTSNPGCTAVRVLVGPGNYQVRVTIGFLQAVPAGLTIG